MLPARHDDDDITDTEHTLLKNIVNYTIYIYMIINSMIYSYNRLYYLNIL